MTTNYQFGDVKLDPNLKDELLINLRAVAAKGDEGLLLADGQQRIWYEPPPMMKGYQLGRWYIGTKKVTARQVLFQTALGELQRLSEIEHAKNVLGIKEKRKDKRGH